MPAGGSTAPVATAGAGGSAQPMGGGAVAPPPNLQPVLVDAADVAACQAPGPPPTEEVTVLEIRTSDAVPGGFVTQAGTTYSCFWVEIDMPEKHHIVGWEGAVNDRAVHHQQVSIGKMPFVLGGQQGGLCALPSVEYTWTGARPPEWTPSLVGFPIGGPENGGKATFVWQTHFEGATTYMGGFNAHITKQLRKYDAGNFEQGDVRGISIPAMSQATHVATCTPEMTMQKLTHPIYVYTAMLHAHLTIQHIKGELFRNGQLIHTFGDEMSLGFGFFDQTFKPQTPCVEIRPGDQIVTTCDYNNTFPFEVMGGEATNQEMCTTFMQYFPRLPVNANNFCGTISGGLGP
jgi:hypothetical protein